MVVDPQYFFGYPNWQQLLHCCLVLFWLYDERLRSKSAVAYDDVSRMFLKSKQIRAIRAACVRRYLRRVV